jgi:hypothetical protein
MQQEQDKNHAIEVLEEQEEEQDNNTVKLDQESV